MEDKKAEQIIKNSPKITKKMLNEVNKYFRGYLFYELTEKKDGRKFYCTCCNKEFTLNYIQRTTDCYKCESLTANHNESGQCPYCKNEVTYKNIGKSKKCISLKEYLNFAFILPKNHNEVYILCCLLYKDYEFCKTPDIECIFDSMYYITANKGVQLKKDYWINKFYIENKIKEPFYCPGGYAGYAPYIPFALDSLNNTFLKYSALEYYKTDRICKYLALYPTHKPFEIMVKLGLYSYVDDVIYSNKENKRLIDWQATKAQDVFKMSKQDFNELRRLNFTPSMLKIHKSLNRLDDFTLAQTADSLKRFYISDVETIINISKKYKVKPKKIINYIRRLHTAKTNQSEKMIFITWRDYIMMAKKLNYDLSQEIVAFPKDLIDAHDQAVEIINLKKAEEDRAKNKELEKQQKSLYKKRQKQYAYQNEQFAIVVPKSVQDIVAEGQALKHCVGGYAERHAKGKLTILFLRDKSKIDSPLYTIEMWDTKLIQVQGYKNETPLTPKAQKFLNEWLEYVQNQKSGQKKQNKKATAQAVA